MPATVLVYYTIIVILEKLSFLQSNFCLPKILISQIGTGKVLKWLFSFFPFCTATGNRLCNAIDYFEPMKLSNNKSHFMKMTTSLLLHTARNPAHNLASLVYI